VEFLDFFIIAKFYIRQYYQWKLAFIGFGRMSSAAGLGSRGVKRSGIATECCIKRCSLAYLKVILLDNNIYCIFMCIYLHISILSMKIDLKNRVFI
jgi:hypothetical protein